MMAPPTHLRRLVLEVLEEHPEIDREPYRAYIAGEARMLVSFTVPTRSLDAAVDVVMALDGSSDVVADVAGQL
ncbi:MAG: hypothetical protein M3024_13320 [Candidatus Dormibacteraeota bacterium]|nr:hypothetical protein [Candidatus Dormibacteraeota bacterium]